MKNARPKQAIPDQIASRRTNVTRPELLRKSVENYQNYFDTDQTDVSLQDQSPSDLTADESLIVLVIFLLLATVLFAALD